MKSFSKTVLVNSDSTKADSTNKVYLISQKQLVEINRQSIDFDSLTVRFRDLTRLTNTRLHTIQLLSNKLSEIYREESKLNLIIIQNDKKTQKRLFIKIIWQKIKIPVFSLAMFYTGYLAGQSNILN